MSANLHSPSRTTTIAQLQLHIELLGIEPLIWRRIHVPGTITLPRLHRTIQAVMGWSDCHLHEFEIAGTCYGIPDPDWPMGPPITSEVRMRLINCLGARKQFTYLYDFGDSWQHKITIEKALSAAHLKHPLCIGGENACPPEDVGGIYGYNDFLEAIRSPEHPEHDNYLSWYGGEFDPACFDLTATNQKLARIKF